MITFRSVMFCADNSGARLLRCIGIPGGTGKRSAAVGDIVMVSVIATTSKRSSGGTMQKISKGSKYRALVVRTKKNILRDNGSVLSFGTNAAVLLNKQGEPVGRRVFGPVAREVRVCPKVFSIAKEVL